MKSAAEQRSFRFHYSTTIREEHASSTNVEVWIPLPQNTEHQLIGPVEIETSLDHREGVEPVSGNRMLHVRVPRGSHGRIVTRYDVLRRRVRLEASAAEHPPDFDLGGYVQYLSTNAKVPVDGFIADQARAITGARDTPLLRARKLYEYLINTLEYDSAGCTPERAGQLGDLAHTCDIRKGTCTEFHGLFVGYARAVGVPARFNFGFNVPDAKEEGRIAGYHCWAEVFLPRAGWFPVDVTESIKARGRGDPASEAEFYFGGTDCHRVHVSNGRDLWLEPRQPGGPLDKLIFSHAIDDAGRVIEPDLAFSFSRAREI